MSKLRPTPPDWGFFRQALLGWFRPERRPMPWKGVRDPYRVWLSEIILQQTRVEQGRPYYERFVAAYPTVTDLAAAADDAVLKLWEGLGYYSRARNLLRAARTVAYEMGGEFPDTYAGLLALPGVGPYTAAAIASFAFDRPTPVLDGNVFRILARYAGDATPTDTTPGKRHFGELVARALGDAHARRFNQAIMDFGALVCTPKAARCTDCPLATACHARRSGTVYELPTKKKKPQRRTRYFNYLVVRDGAGRTLVEQRGDGDIWAGLYQFPLLETARPDPPLDELAGHPDWPATLPPGRLRFLRSSPPYRQQLTHQTIVGRFHTFVFRPPPPAGGEQWAKSNKMLENLAFPRLITRFLADKSLFLDLF